MLSKCSNRYNFAPQYQRAEFDVKVILGAADLKLQIWGKTGQMSRDHDEIEVQWNPPGSSLSPSGAASGGKAADEFGMYTFSQ